MQESMSLKYVPASTNPHDKATSTNLEFSFTLTETPKKGSMSINSTGLYRGVIIPIFGNQSIGRIVRAGGAPHAPPDTSNHG